MARVPTPRIKPGKGGEWLWHPDKGIPPLGPLSPSDATHLAMSMKYMGCPTKEEWRLLRTVYHSGRKQGRQEAMNGYADQ